MGGTTLAINRLKELQGLAFIERYKKIDPSSNIILVFGGTNDFGSAPNQATPLGDPDSKDPHTFIGAYRLLIEGIKKDYPKARLVLMTPILRNDAISGFPKTSPFNEFGLTLNDYRLAVLSLGKRYGVQVLDAYTIKEFSPSNPHYADYSHDGLHPSDQGHALLADYIIKNIF